MPRGLDTIKLATSIYEVPEQAENPKMHQWDIAQGRLWIQTDNHQIEQIFGGFSVLSDDTLRPVCVRIARRLWSLIEKGWRPRLDTTSFIEWNCRKFNAVADHAANAACDLPGEFHIGECQDSRMAIHASANLRLCES